MDLGEGQGRLERLGDPLCPVSVYEVAVAVFGSDAIEVEILLFWLAIEQEGALHRAGPLLPLGRSSPGATSSNQMWQALFMAGGGLEGITIQEYDGAATAKIADQLIQLRAQENEAEDVDYRKGLALKQTECDGFRCFTASCDGEIVGFTYGMYNSQGVGLNGPGQISSVGARDLVEQCAGHIPLISLGWRSAFDIAEVQVLAAYRGRGIGKKLVREICASLPGEDPVVLCVHPDNAGAEHVYERVGFRRLIPFPISSMHLPQPQILMGLRHAKDAAVAGGAGPNR